MNGHRAPHGGRGGAPNGMRVQYNPHRGAMANYPSGQIMSNGQYNSTHNNRLPALHTSRNVAYPNNNYLVTHRVEELSVVQVINAADQPQHLQRHPHGSNSPASVVPIPKVTPPTVSPSKISGENMQPEVVAGAVVPYRGERVEGNRGSYQRYNHAPPVSSSTSPSSSTDDSEDYSIPELDMGVHHYKMLGEMFGEIYIKSNRNIELLRKKSKLLHQLRAEKEALERQRQEDEESRQTQIREYEERLEQLRQQNDSARRECVSWRESVMKISQQIEQANIQLANKVQEINTLTSEIEKLKAERDSQRDAIQQLEKNEENLKQEIQSIKELLIKIKQEYNDKCKELESFKTKFEEKASEIKNLNEEHAKTQKNLEDNLQTEKTKVAELTTSVQKRNDKCKALEESLEKYKFINKKLENSKEKLEGKVQDLEKCNSNKDKELVLAIEEKESLQLQKEALDAMFKEQNAMIIQLKKEKEVLTSKNAQLTKKLDHEIEFKKRVREEQLEIYKKHYSVMRLYDSGHDSAGLPPPPPGQLALPMPTSQNSSIECSSPVASEEVSESAKADQNEEEGHGRHNDLERSETEGNYYRKRRYPATSTTDEMNKEAKRSSTSGENDKVSDSTEIRSHDKAEEPSSYRRNSFNDSREQSPNDTGDNPRQSSSSNFNKGGINKAGHSSDQSRVIRFPNTPNINLKK